MKRSRWAAVGVLAALLGTTAVTMTANPASAAVPVRGTFFPLDPVRVLDTRDGTGVDGQHAGPLGAGQVTRLHITGVGGVPTTGAGAVVLNVTATEAPGPGYITTYPCGDVRPIASNVNYTRGVNVPNQVTVKIGMNGDVCFYAHTEVQIVADLSGYYADDFAAVPGYRYHELDPARILDTRDGTGLQGGRLPGPLAAGEVLALQVEGAGGVPSDGARAVTMNVTTADPAAAGYLTVFPCDHPRPTVSNLNFDPSAPAVANLVTVRVPADGQVCFFANQAVDVVADVQGYFAPGPGSVFTAVSPVRVMDTRDGTGVDGRRRGPYGAGEVRRLNLGGTNDIPSDARAVLLNVTVTEATGRGYVTVCPCGLPRPLASNLNFVAGVDRANLVKVRMNADGDVCFFSQTTTQIVVDLNGYYTPLALARPRSPRRRALSRPRHQLGGLQVPLVIGVRARRRRHAERGGVGVDADGRAPFARPVDGCARRTGSGLRGQRAGPVERHPHAVGRRAGHHARVGDRVVDHHARQPPVEAGAPAVELGGERAAVREPVHHDALTPLRRLRHHGQRLLVALGRLVPPLAAAPPGGVAARGHDAARLAASQHRPRAIR